MGMLKIASLNQRKTPSATNRIAAGKYPTASKLIPQELFLHALQLEQRRTERSGRSFLLVLISGDGLENKSYQNTEFGAIASLSACIRETDVLGWYEDSKTLGLMMTEIGEVSTSLIEAIVRKISLVLEKSLSAEVYCRVAVAVRIFPQESEDRFFSLDKSKRNGAVWVDSSLKRLIDILGSIAALVALFPLFIAIGILVKCTSKGPIFFCKKRVGRYGKEFSFYKFRTMNVNNDPNIHLEFVSKLIAGEADTEQNGGLYKMKSDPRITAVGRFLRRTSLDELPQFYNVLVNDMSLVGPRPPLPYEYEKYSNWHKRRVLELKPGITGLWQVEARSLTTFDEMVRIDIRYFKARTFWLDLKIMLRTPGAMLFGRGAC